MNNSLLHKRLSVFLVIGMVAAVLFLLPLAVANAQIVECSGIGDATTACNFCDIFVVISNTFNFLVLQITAPLATFVLIVGGLIMMFGGASPTLLTRAKAIMKGTIIGLGIVLLSWIIVNSTINVLTGTDSPDGFPWPWHSPSCGGNSGAAPPPLPGPGMGGPS